MGLSIVILTFNSEESIGSTLKSARCLSDDIHVVDSGSTDRTVEIARAAGAHLYHHPFESYGAQRNWAIDELSMRYEWQLHLDADERLSDALIDAIGKLDAQGFPGPTVGYFIPRLVHFLGHPIRHGGMYPIWHMRLFRRGRGRCETRRYDQHFYVDGATGRLDAPMIDDIRMTIDEWVIRHLRWADAEAHELSAATSADGMVTARFQGNPVERKRAMRGLYNKMPLFLRAFLLFIYRYIFRFGFLDGRAGLIFFVLQTFWFRFIVDAKLYLLRSKSQS